MAGPLGATGVALRRFVRGSGGLARKGTASLHPKHGPRGYYKGNRTRSMGRHTRKARYIVDYDNKVPEFVLPCMDTDLRPYVSTSTPKVKIPPPPLPQ